MPTARLACARHGEWAGAPIQDYVIHIYDPAPPENIAHKSHFILVARYRPTRGPLSSRPSRHFRSYCPAIWVMLPPRRISHARKAANHFSQLKACFYQPECYEGNSSFTEPGTVARSRREPLRSEGLNLIPKTTATVFPCNLSGFASTRVQSRVLAYS